MGAWAHGLIGSWAGGAAAAPAADPRPRPGSPPPARATSPSLIDTKRTFTAGEREAMLAKLAESLAVDTLRNENELRPRIRRWFADGSVAGLEALSRRVYDEIFLTPGDDPWMGLVSSTSFTALEGGGVTTRR